MKLVQRYVVEEFFGPSILALVIFTFVLLTKRIDDFVTLFSAHGISWGMIFKMIGLLLPYLLTMTLPMGMMIACLMVFSRWNSDRELLALRISGVNLWSIVIPLLLISMVATGVSMYFTTTLVPWSLITVKKTLYQVAATLAQNLDEQSFNKFGNNLVVYVQKAGEKPGDYQGVTLFYSKGNKVDQILTAEKGSISVDIDKAKTSLIMDNGTVYKLDSKDPDHFYIGTFEKWQSVVGLERFLPSPDQGPQKPREYTMSGLRDKINLEKQSGNSGALYRLELGRRFAFPFACMVFILIGVPLGASWKVKNRTLGFFLGVSMIVVYWILLTFSESLGMKGKVTPELAVWLPNIILGSLGGYFTWRTCRQ
jgi:lipopolysaccharide export system permease protein